MSESKPGLARRLFGRVSRALSIGASKPETSAVEIESGSIFLSLTPRAKFPPYQRPAFSPEELLELSLALAVRCTAGSLASLLTSGAHELGKEIATLEEMRADREFVKKVKISFGRSEDELCELRGEFRFAISLLERVREAEPGEAGAVRLLLEAGLALRHMQENVDAVSSRVDELGAHWYELEQYDSPAHGAPLIGRVTLYVHSVGPILFVVMGESPSDIDTWVQFSRFAHSSREVLYRVRDALIEGRPEQ